MIVGYVISCCGPACRAPGRRENWIPNILLLLIIMIIIFSGPGRLEEAAARALSSQIDRAGAWSMRPCCNNFLHTTPRKHTV